MNIYVFLGVMIAIIVSFLLGHLVIKNAVKGCKICFWISLFGLTALNLQSLAFLMEFLIKVYI